MELSVFGENDLVIIEVVWMQIQIMFCLEERAKTVHNLSSYFERKVLGF